MSSKPILPTVPAVSTPTFPEVFNDEHHSWHNGAHAEFPMRSIPAGQPGSGLEFLQFHRDFMAKVLQWYFQQPFADANAVAACPAIPEQLKKPEFGWNAREAEEERRIVELNPPFHSEDALGIFIETEVNGQGAPA